MFGTRPLKGGINLVISQSSNRQRAGHLIGRCPHLCKIGCFRFLAGALCLWIRHTTTKKHGIVCFDSTSVLPATLSPSCIRSKITISSFSASVRGFIISLGALLVMIWSTGFWRFRFLRMIYRIPTSFRNCGAGDGERVLYAMDIEIMRLRIGQRKCLKVLDFSKSASGRQKIVELSPSDDLRTWSKDDRFEMLKSALRHWEASHTPTNILQEERHDVDVDSDDTRQLHGYVPSG